MPIKEKEAYNEYMRKYMLRRYYQRKKMAFELLGNRCAECGAKRKLQIDHVDCFTKVKKSNRLWNMAKPKFLAELKKCQLLCETCHDLKSQGKGGDLSKRAILREARKRAAGRS